MNKKVIYKKSLNGLLILFSLLNVLFVCLLTVNIPYESQQKYTADYLVDASFSCSSSKLYFLPITAIFESNNGRSFKKQLLKDQELFCISKQESSIANKLPSRNDFGSLRFEISYSKGQLLLGDLIIGGRKVALDHHNVKIIEGSDKSSVEFDNGKFIFNSVPLSSFGFSKLSIEIPGNIFSEAKKESTDISFLLRKAYYICYLAQLHAHYAIILALIFVLLLLLKYPHSYLIRATLFLSVSLLSCIAILWPYTHQIFMLMQYGDEYDAIIKIVLSQFPTILIMCVPLFIYQVIGRAKYAFMLCGFILYIIYVSDLFTIAQFSTHPAFSDLMHFSSDILKSKHIIYGFIKTNKEASLLIVLTLFFYISLWSLNKYEDQTLGQIKRGIFIILMFLISEIPQKVLLKEYLLDSIYTIALKTSNKNVDYTESYQYQTDDTSLNTVEGLNRRKNVIIVMIESLSANESQYWDGFYNSTRNIDKLGKEFFSFKNYYANTYNTDYNNFVFLTSMPYLNNKKSSHDSYYYHNTVPQAFKREGYTTYVMSSADDIGGLRKVWELAGFDYFYEGNDPFYADSERLTFNTVPDLDMYKNLLSKMQDWEKKGPYFTFLMTSTSHGPYIVPKTHELDYHKCIEYVDDSLYYLYQELEKRGFFDNGMLVVTGDHRYMEEYSHDEKKKHDKRGIARVPLIIVDKDLKNIALRQPFSHAQMGQFIEYLNLKKVDLYRFNFIPSLCDSNKSVKPIYYQYHTPSDSVLVITENSKNGEFEVKLNGDKTRFVFDVKDENFKKKVFEDIYFLRR